MELHISTAVSHIEKNAIRYQKIWFIHGSMVFECTNLRAYANHDCNGYDNATKRKV